MNSPRSFRVLKGRTKKAPLPNTKFPAIFLQGESIEKERIIRLPKINRSTGLVDGAVLIVRQSNREKVRKVVRRVKAKVRRSKKSAA